MCEKRVYIYEYKSPDFKEDEGYLIKTLEFKHELTESEKSLFKKQSFKERILDKLRRVAMIFKLRGLN